MAVRVAVSLVLTPTIQSQSNSNNEHRKPNTNPSLFLTKASWLVRTESNVRKQVRKKPEPACVVCQGTGRVDCNLCSGKGRTNHVHLTMLPEGEWPKWCRCCGGSGLSYCSRCLGTGEYRYIMGFHFIKPDTHCSQTGQAKQEQEQEQEHLPNQGAPHQSGTV